MQDASEIGRFGSDLLTKFNTLSRGKGPEATQKMLEVGDQILKDPKFQNEWGGIKTVTDIARRSVQPQSGFFDIPKNVITRFSPGVPAQAAHSIPSNIMKTDLQTLQTTAQQGGREGLSLLDKLANAGDHKGVVDLGGKMMNDPKYKEYAAGIKMMMDTSASAIGSAATSLPLHAFGGVSMISQKMLDDLRFNQTGRGRQSL